MKTLTKVRNQLAHPKYQTLRYESKAMPLKDAQRHYRELGDVLHDIEMSLTPEMAYKTLNAVLNLEQMLRATLSPEIVQSSSKRLVICDEDISEKRPGKSTT